MNELEKQIDTVLMEYVSINEIRREAIIKDILAIPAIADAQAEIERLRKTLDWIASSACEDLEVAKLAAQKALEVKP